MSQRAVSSGHEPTKRLPSVPSSRCVLRAIGRVRTKAVCIARSTPGARKPPRCLKVEAPNNPATNSECPQISVLARDGGLDRLRKLRARLMQSHDATTASRGATVQTADGGLCGNGKSAGVRVSMAQVLDPDRPGTSALDSRSPEDALSASTKWRRHPCRAHERRFCNASTSPFPKSLVRQRT